ncbi:unnamed protein product [Miscanthus lutarioriparius]|uniref:Uncharacterized protein n=1 Tax=Miscanthus lutarioriparius TaxID=422564 RepID=A0A811NPJ8_9POAL|nr:unnamed protein product [Miscanthus lutarioriparius]
MAAQGGSKNHWKGLYAGLAGNIVGVLPYVQKTAGAIGGAAASLIRVPTEVVKQRMQMSQFKTAPDAVRLIVAKEGIKGLYAGYGSFLLRDLPFEAIQFCIYEQLRIGYRLTAKRELKDAENAIIGAFAGAITGALTTPLDVMKTRLMIQGIEPRVLWIGIGGSIFFGVLEKTKSILAERNIRR